MCLCACARACLCPHHPPPLSPFNHLTLFLSHPTNDFFFEFLRSNVCLLSLYLSHSHTHTTIHSLTHTLSLYSFESRGRMCNRSSLYLSLSLSASFVIFFSIPVQISFLLVHAPTHTCTNTQRSHPLVLTHTHTHKPKCTRFAIFDTVYNLRDIKEVFVVFLHTHTHTYTHTHTHTVYDLRDVKEVFVVFIHARTHKHKHKHKHSIQLEGRQRGLCRIYVCGVSVWDVKEVFVVFMCVSVWCECVLCGVWDVKQVFVVFMCVSVCCLDGISSHSLSLFLIFPSHGLPVSRCYFSLFSLSSLSAFLPPSRLPSLFPPSSLCIRLSLPPPPSFLPHSPPPASLLSDLHLPNFCC